MPQHLHVRWPVVDFRVVVAHETESEMNYKLKSRSDSLNLIPMTLVDGLSCGMETIDVWF